jgi:uncharacterized protein YycO
MLSGKKRKMSYNLSNLKEGDYILYWHNNPLSWVINWVTEYKVSHVAIYAGNNQCVEARLKGVNIYPMNTKGIISIRRAKKPIDFNAGMDWFNRVAKGQRYDWEANFGFITGGEGAQRKMMCSEFATRFTRKEGMDIFYGDDADRIAPFRFLVTEFLYDVK